MRSQNAITNPFLRIELLKPILYLLKMDKNLWYTEGHLKQNEVVKVRILFIILPLLELFYLSSLALICLSISDWIIKLVL